MGKICAATYPSVSRPFIFNEKTKRENGGCSKCLETDNKKCFFAFVNICGVEFSANMCQKSVINITLLTSQFISLMAKNADSCEKNVKSF
jgi:hypothetical protein